MPATLMIGHHFSISALSAEPQNRVVAPIARNGVPYSERYFLGSSLHNPNLESCDRLGEQRKSLDADY
jgi:hypothetical protein